MRTSRRLVEKENSQASYEGFSDNGACKCPPNSTVKKLENFDSRAMQTEDKVVKKDNDIIGVRKT